MRDKRQKERELKRLEQEANEAEKQRVHEEEREACEAEKLKQDAKEAEKQSS